MKNLIKHKLKKITISNKMIESILSIYKYKEITDSKYLEPQFGNIFCFEEDIKDILEFQKNYYKNLVESIINKVKEMNLAQFDSYCWEYQIKIPYIVDFSISDDILLQSILEIVDRECLTLDEIKRNFYQKKLNESNNYFEKERIKVFLLKDSDLPKEVCVNLEQESIKEVIENNNNKRKESMINFENNKGSFYRKKPVK